MYLGLRERHPVVMSSHVLCIKAPQKQVIRGNVLKTPYLYLCLIIVDSLLELSPFIISSY